MSVNIEMKTVCTKLAYFRRFRRFSSGDCVGLLVSRSFPYTFQAQEAVTTYLPIFINS